MTLDEQKEMGRLEEQLQDVRQNAEETRIYLLSALGKINDEARMYRGLFWSLLGLSLLILTFRFLQH